MYGRVRTYGAPTDDPDRNLRSQSGVLVRADADASYETPSKFTGPRKLLPSWRERASSGDDICEDAAKLARGPTGGRLRVGGDVGAHHSERRGPGGRRGAQVTGVE